MIPSDAGPVLDVSGLRDEDVEVVLAALRAGVEARAADGAQPVVPDVDCDPADGRAPKGGALRWRVPDAGPAARWAARQWGWTVQSLAAPPAPPATVASGALDTAPAVAGVAVDPDVAGLRVLVVCHEASRTGAPLALLGVARWLAGRGALIQTVLLVDGPLREDFAGLGAVHTARHGSIEVAAFAPFDVVYANTIVSAVAMTPLAGSGRPMVLHAHELGATVDAHGADAVRRAARAARHIVTVSAGTEAVMRDLLWPFHRPSTRTTEPLLDERIAAAAALAPAAAPAHPLRVGGFGTFCALKGGDLLARMAVLAALDPATAGWSFSWLGGRAPDADALLASSGAAAGPHPLRFLGELAEPLPALARFDVLALLSRQDSYPLAMLEAALVGVPTLAQQHSGGPEEFALGGGAAIVAAERPDLALDALRALERAPELRRLMAAAGRRQVLAGNRIDRVATEVAAALLDAVRPSLLPGAGRTPVSAGPVAPPSVSIVIPVFNRSDMTEACLRALAATVDAATVELIVVDNGSTDGSAGLVERLWPGATVLRNAENRGFARGCNQGVAAAHADRVVLLNNDTEPCPGWLEALLGPLDGTDVGLVAPKLLFPDGTIQHAGLSLIEDRPHGLALNALHDHYRADASNADANRPRDRRVVTGAVLAMRRAVFEEVGGFDEGYWNGCEDVDLCLAMAAAGYRIVYEPGSVLVHHESASGAERWTKVNDNLRRLAEKWRDRAGPDLVITETGAVVPVGTVPLDPPEGTITVALEGAVFGYHSLSQVNRELAVRLAADEACAVVAQSRERPDLSPDDDPRLRAVAAASAASPPLAPAVRIRHQWPPDWRAPEDDAPLVVVQPWEFGGLPDEWVEPVRTLADEVWCYTTWLRDCYVRSGIPAELVHVLPIGVDPARFHPDGPGLPLRTGRSVRLLFVGGLIHRKGVDVLLEAYGRAFGPDDDVCLVVKSFGGDGVYRHAAGTGALRAALERPDGPEIEWIDRDLDQAEMAALYRSCDVLVHPYRGEGFGMPIAEAMASGLAVVVTDDGAARDFCDADTALLVASRRVAIAPGEGGLPPSRTGYWFAEPDVDSLTEQLRRIVHDAPLRARLAAAGRDRVLRRLDWTAIAADAAQRLRALAARPARRVLVADPFRPDAPPHPLEAVRSRTLLVVAGPGRPRWEQAASTVAAVLDAADDVTVVVAVEAGTDAAREATLAQLEQTFGAVDADVLVEFAPDDAVLAGLLVRCDATVAGDAALSDRARRCCAATVPPGAAPLRAWLADRAAGRAA